jgi:hypothetical protein
VPPSAASKRPRALLVGAGERALHVAEQLALDELARHRAAVHDDERLVVPRRAGVQTPRDEFFARTTLASDEHTLAGLRDARDLLVEPARREAVVGDQQGICGGVGRRAAQAQVLAQQASVSTGAVDGLLQQVESHRLGEEVERTVLHRLHGERHGAVPGHDHDRQFGVLHGDLAERFHAAETRQVQVEQHDVGFALLQHGRQVIGVLARVHLMAHAREFLAEHLAQALVVFDEQHRRGRGRAVHRLRILRLRKATSSP